MKKRMCERFIIPGTTLYYKINPRFWGKGSFSGDYYPVLDISRGGLKFLSNERLKAGSSITLKLIVPGFDEQPEIKGILRWISRNREVSYRYQNGIAFNSYGSGEKQNPESILDFIKRIEYTPEQESDKDSNL